MMTNNNDSGVCVMMILVLMAMVRHRPPPFANDFTAPALLDGGARVGSQKGTARDSGDG